MLYQFSNQIALDVGMCAKIPHLLKLYQMTLDLIYNAK